MNNNKNRSNSKTKSFDAGNSNKKKKSSSVKNGKKSIPKADNLRERKGRDLISPKTIDYSKSSNFY